MATITERKTLNGKKAYRAEVRRKGYPKQFKTFPRKNDAVKWARKVEREMDEGTWRNLKGAHELILKDALDRYLKSISSKKRKNTYKRDEYSVSKLKEHMGNLSIAQITGSEVVKYRDKRLEEVSAHSVRIELALLSHLFNIAKDEWDIGILENPVSKNKKPKIPEGRCPVLSEEQLGQLLKECKEAKSKYLYPFVLLALHTGCRSMELRSLKWSQVDFKKKSISLVGEQTKTHRSRTIPLTVPALNILINLKSEANIIGIDGKTAGLIFPAKNKPDKPRDIHMAFDRAVKKADLNDLPGLGKLRIHDLRHCCATALIAAGVPIEIARKILGHKYISTTQGYLHVVNEKLMKDEISKIGSLGLSTKANEDAKL